MHWLTLIFGLLSVFLATARLSRAKDGTDILFGAAWLTCGAATVVIALVNL